MRRLLIMALVEAVTALLALAYFPFDFGVDDVGTLEMGWSRLLWLALLSIPSSIVFVGATLLWIRSFATVVEWVRLNWQAQANA